MSADPKVIERVRKLMSKVGDAGTTQAESDSAMAMAMKIMAEHNIAMSELNDSDSSYLASQIYEFGRYSLEIDLACRIINVACFVQSIKTEHPKAGQKRWFKLEVFGEQTNVENARYMFIALLNSFESLFIQYRIKSGCAQKERRGFIEGVAAGFLVKLQESIAATVAESSNSQKTGLALVSQKERVKNKMDEYNKKNGIELYDMKTQFKQTNASRDTYRNGFEQGKKLNLNKKVGNDSNQKQIR